MKGGDKWTTKQNLKLKQEKINVSVKTLFLPNWCHWVFRAKVK